MTAFVLPQGKQNYETATGAPAVGWKLYTTDTGTNNPRTTWLDTAQVTPNANPVVLDARGEAVIFWSGSYRVRLEDNLGNTIWTVDGVNYVDPTVTMLADLATFSSSTKGAGMIGFGPSVNYPANTVGAYLNLLFARTSAEIAAGVTVVNYFRPPGNLFRYGGVGGSVALDTIAWLAAIAQANQLANDAAEIFVPVTTSGFFVNTTATATRPIKIRGCGSLVSLIVATIDIHFLILDASGANAAYGCVIEDVGFTGVYTAATGDGIRLTNSHDTILRGVRVTGFGIGLQITGVSSYGCRLTDCAFEGNKIKNINAGAQTHQLKMSSVRFGSSGANLTPVGMAIVDSNTLYMDACDCEGLRGPGTVIGLDIDATAALVADYMLAIHFENNANTLGEIRIGATFDVQGVTLDGTIMANTAVGVFGLNLVKATGVTWIGAAFFSNFGTANINYGTTAKCNIIPVDSLTTQGVVTLGNGTVSLPQSAAAQVIVNGSTILTANKTVIRVSEAGAVNSIKLQVGTFAGQDCTVINESNFTVQFDVVANSNVADGATAAIPALCSRKFTWDSGTTLWYRAA